MVVHLKYPPRPYVFLRGIAEFFAVQLLNGMRTQTNPKTIKIIKPILDI